MLIGPHKVDTMFGYPGAAILPVFDQLYKTLKRSSSTAMNKPPATARTAMPGDRQAGRVYRHLGSGGDKHRHTAGDRAARPAPIIVFSGQVATKVIGNDAFQEADVTGITRPCTKWNYLVKDVRELPRVVNEAFMIATSGRPGPVLVDLPKDVSTMICPDEVDDTPREHIVKGVAPP